MSNSIDDIAGNAQAFFVIGSNTTEQHPIIGMRLRQAVKQRGAILIVADPRRIPLTDFASLHLRHKPGTDIALLNGLMHIILEKGWADTKFIEERAEGFDEFKATVMQYPPEKVSEITGVPVSDLEQAAKIMGASKPMAVLWAMGITQHITGVRNVMDLANLQMLLGNMGVAGGGVNPLRGQNNVQGACDMGGLPDVYPGYQPVTDPAVREKFAKAWGLLLKDEGGRRKDETEAEENILHPSSFILSDKVGMTVTEMIPGILEGKTHALYILGEDPVMSDADTNHIRHCLESVDFLVLQELFESETAAYADVLLPGVSFAEKSGTFTNTERRVQMVRKAVEPPGEAREDWWITAELAKRVLQIFEVSPSERMSETSEVSRRVDANAPYAGWNYENTTQIMAEIAALTPQYTGISHARLERGETLQWPCPNAEHPGTPILHIGKFTRGLGKFMPIEHIPPAELPDDEYPMVLSTGRVLYHWHGGQMSRRSKGLLEIYPKPLIEVNEEDAEKLGLNGNKRVRVTSRRGSIEAEAQVTDRVPPGMVYGNFHFPQASVNELTIAALDPVSKIPEFKVCAVKVEVVE
ncbi:MAG: molybdopterin-dependent oxidoreductase [Chloroflexi bacterium]|nr:molybdopterin-dependent oxidoreductase [Chloroflexota bacterium]